MLSQVKLVLALKKQNNEDQWFEHNRMLPTPQVNMLLYGLYEHDNPLVIEAVGWDTVSQRYAAFVAFRDPLAFTTEVLQILLAHGWNLKDEIFLEADANNNLQPVTSANELPAMLRQLADNSSRYDKGKLEIMVSMLEPNCNSVDLDAYGRAAWPMQAGNQQNITTNIRSLTTRLNPKLQALGWVMKYEPGKRVRKIWFERTQPVITPDAKTTQPQPTEATA